MAALTPSIFNSNLLLFNIQNNKPPQPLKMAFKMCSAIIFASLNVLILAQPLTYLRDNQVQPFQAAPVNYINNVVDNSYPGALPVNYVSSINNGGLIQYPFNNGFGSNFINNVNTLNGGYSTFLQPSPAIISSYPGVVPVQYGSPLVQPIGGYNTQNQLSQISPVQVNF